MTFRSSMVSQACDLERAIRRLENGTKTAARNDFIMRAPQWASPSLDDVAVAISTVLADVDALARDMARFE